MRPNVIIINPDQMRADSMRHMGNAAAYTPNLDALAQQGVSFSAAFCQNPVCVPSRCSFMTGLYPHAHGHRTMSYLLHPDEENLFGDMKKAGYYTVSSTRGDLMAGQFPEYHKRIIDEYIRVPKPKERMNRFVPERGDAKSDTYYSFLSGIIPTQTAEELAINMDDLTIDGAVNSLRKRPKDKPVFMFIGLMYPHPPYQIEQKYYGLVDKTKLPPRVPTIRDEDGKPAMERGLRDALRVGNWSEERLDELRAIYLAMCAKVDDQIGRLVEELKAEGIYDDTIILVFSDHGDYTGDFGVVEKAQNCFPDCLTNIPFIIKPAKQTTIQPGINDCLVELVDVCATVGDLVGIPIEREHFSRSLVPVMQDNKRGHREYVVCEGGRLPGEIHCSEFNSQHFNPSDHYAPRQQLQAREDGTHTKAVMVRTTRYKYVHRLQERDEFYDLKKGEQINLIDAPEYARQIRELQDMEREWYMATCDVVPRKLDERFTKEFLQNNLKAVGMPSIVGRMLSLYLKLAGKSPSQFIDQMRHKAE